RLGQSQPPVTAREQFCAKPLFECMDLAADGGLRQEQFFRRPGETQVASRRLEAPKKVEFRQLTGFPSHACSSCETFQKIVWCALTECGKWRGVMIYWNGQRVNRPVIVIGGNMQIEL